MTPENLEQLRTIMKEKSELLAQLTAELTHASAERHAALLDQIEVARKEWNEAANNYIDGVRTKLT